MPKKPPADMKFTGTIAGLSTGKPLGNDSETNPTVTVKVQTTAALVSLDDVMAMKAAGELEIVIRPVQGTIPGA